MPNLAKFLDAGKRLAEAGKLPGLSFGVVYAETADGNVVLALTADVTREHHTTEAFDGENLHAWRSVAPIAELDSLIAQLRDGHIHAVGKPIANAPLILRTEGKPYDWQFVESQPVERWQGVSLRHYGGGPLASLAGQELFQRADRLVATGSQHRIASLARLGVLFVGEPLRATDYVKAELWAPWPIGELSARREGDNLRVEITGFSDLDPARFILNVEGEQGDQRFRPTKRWVQGPSDLPDRSTYVKVLPRVGAVAAAVNAYVRDVDEVWLRTELQGDLGGFGLGRPKQGRRPIPIAKARTHVVQLEAEGYRCLRKVSLDLTPVTVIVGRNQAGKSTVLDTLEFLRETVSGRLSEAVSNRGGYRSLVWREKELGALVLGVTVETAERRRFRYRLQLGPVGGFDYAVAAEELAESNGDAWHPVMRVRDGAATLGGGATTRSDDPHESILSQLLHPSVQPASDAVRSGLGWVARYPYFDTWSTQGARAPARIEPEARLGPHGEHLAAVLHALSQVPEEWAHFLQIVRVAFPNLGEIQFPSTARGQLQFVWREGSSSFDASELSDGTISFLAALAALFEPGDSLVAIDEPEQHLHPDALYRLAGAARVLGERRPVVFATQSDRLLAYFDESPESVVIARRGPEGTELIRPDAQMLAKWLAEFSLADMRHELESWAAGE